MSQELLFKMSPSNLENVIAKHFTYLFKVRETIIVKDGNIALKWLRCAFTEKGRAVLIEVNSSETKYRTGFSNPLRIYRGKIRIEEVEQIIEGVNRRFIAIYCRKNNLIALFSRLMADVIWHLINDGPEDEDPWAFIVQRMEGWKLLFFDHDSKAEEKGLIGELFVLRDLLIKYNFSVKMWSGPLGGIKDFRLSGQNIEVKTSSIRNGYFIEISDVYQTFQLQEIERMVFIRLEESFNGAVSVSDLVDEIRQNIFEVDEILDFEKRLDEFSDDILSSSNRWNILEAVVMNIDEEFPKISERSFVNNHLPYGVIKIRWMADLASVPKIDFVDFDFKRNA